MGSFGDNELCPECLDGVNNILKENTICIPSSYRNFLSKFLELKKYFLNFLKHQFNLYVYIKILKIWKVTIIIIAIE